MVIGIHEYPLVHQFFRKEVRVTRVVYLDFPHHLPYDNLEVLVIDLHTLETVNLLDFIDNVFLHLDRSENVENVRRGDCSVRKPHAGLHVVVLLNKYLLGKRYEVSLFLSGLALDDDFAVSSLDLAHYHLSVDFGNDGRV